MFYPRGVYRELWKAKRRPGWSSSGAKRKASLSPASSRTKTSLCWSSEGSSRDSRSNMSSGTRTRISRRRKHKFLASPTAVRPAPHRPLEAASNDVRRDQSGSTQHHQPDHECDDRKAHHLTDIELCDRKKGQQPERLDHVRDPLADGDRHGDQPEISRRALT